MLDWVKKNKILCVIIVLVIVLGIPLGIHCLFKQDACCEFWVAEWSAGDVLQYYGAILAFVGTVILGALSLYQNQVIKEESDKRLAMQEQRERESISPQFRINFLLSGGTNSNIRIGVANISDNIAKDIYMHSIHTVNSKKEIVWKYPNALHFDIIKPNEELIVDLCNDPLTTDKCCIKLIMMCSDKYGFNHKYKIYAFCETKSTSPHFQIEEIRDESTC